MAALYRLELFGGLAVELEGRRINWFRTHWSGALLGYLAFI